MKNNHEIILKQYAAYCKEQPLYLGTAGSYGMEMLTIIREGVWAEYDILAAFHPPVGAAVQVRVGANNQISVPIEATAEKGMGKIVFAGYKEGVRQIAVDVLYKVAPSSGASGTEPAEPTPDVVQQILSAANAAEKLAQSVRDDADVGKFTGAKGDKGDIGPTGPKGEQGPKGERGEKGDPGKDAVIDTTLSHAGEAADAAEVGKLKEDLIDTSGTVEYELDGSTIFVDRELYNAEIYNATAVVYLQNRFDYTTIPLYANSYNSLHIITHQDNGLKIIRGKMEERAVTAVVCNYTAEFTGNLWFSCNAKGENAEDVAVNVKNTKNSDAEMLYGTGRLYCMLKVSAGDVIEIRFYTCLNNVTSANTIVYSNIMLQYGVLTDFVEYKTTFKTVSLPKDVSAYSSSTAANGKYRTTIPFKNIAPDYDKSILPMNNDTAAKITISGMELKTYNETFNNINGIGLSSSGTLSIYQNGGGRDEFAYWLRTNDISISYKSKSAVEFQRHLYPSMIVVSDGIANIIGFSKPSTKIKSTVVCMGDSITGMFGHETGYPEMISKKYPEIKAINVGFSGTSVIDHADKNYMPFSFNRLVDAIISGDWSEQDAKVGNISTANYAEHLTTLKDIDFANVDFITVFYGTNDWGYNYSIDTFKEVYSQALKKLQEKYPQIRIVVICPYWRSISDGEDSNINPNNNGIYLYDFSNAIENDVAFAYNLPCINLYRSLGANLITDRYYTQDGTHPTFRTRNIIADKIVKTIL